MLGGSWGVWGLVLVFGVWERRGSGIGVGPLVHGWILRLSKGAEAINHLTIKVAAGIRLHLAQCEDWLHSLLPTVPWVSWGGVRRERKGSHTKQTFCLFSNCTVFILCRTSPA